MNKKTVLLQTKQGYDIFLSAITKELYDSIQEQIQEVKRSKLNVKLKEYDITVFDILAIGEDNVTEQFCREFIPYKHIKRKWAGLAKDEEYISAKCYALDIFDDKTIIHYDCKSSWNGIMLSLNKPQYIVIYKKEHNEN